MTAPDPRLDEIQARLDAHYESIAYADDIAEGSEDLIPEDYERHYCAEDGKDWPCPDVSDYAQEDIRYLLAELRKAHEALAAVSAIEEVLDGWDSLVPFRDAEESQRWYSLGKRHAAERIRTEIAEARAAVAAAKGDEQ